jgi:hypothetical protein
MYTEADIPHVCRLWSDHTEWGKIDEETWRARLVTTPYGDSPVVVAEDDETGLIVGHLAASRTLVQVDDVILPAARPGAAILKPEYRRLVHSPDPNDQPVIAMYNFAVGARRDAGIAFMYMLPNPAWRRLIRMLPAMRCESFPLWSRPLPLGEPIPLEAGYTAGMLPADTTQIDDLWASSRRVHDCQSVKDSTSLIWRLTRDDSHLLTVEYGGVLVGLVTSQPRGDRQWLIGDLVVRDLTDALAVELSNEQALRISTVREAVHAIGGVLAAQAALNTTDAAG